MREVDDGNCNEIEPEIHLNKPCDYYLPGDELCNTHKMTCLENRQEKDMYVSQVCESCNLLECEEVDNDNFRDDIYKDDCNFYSGTDIKWCVSDKMTCLGENGEESEIYASQVCNSCNLLECEEVDNDKFIDNNGINCISIFHILNLNISTQPLHLLQVLYKYQSHS